MALLLWLSNRYRYLWLLMIFILLMLAVPREALLARQAVNPHFYLQYLAMVSDSINIDFLAGVVSAMIWQRMSANAGRCGWCLIAGAVIFFLFAVGWKFAPFGQHGNLHTRMMTLPCLLLFLAGLKFSRMKPVKYPAWLMFTGKISYSLYLLHMAVIFSLVALAQSIFGADYFDDFSHRFNLLWASLGATWLLSWWSYLAIEIKLSVFLRDKVLALIPD